MIKRRLCTICILFLVIQWIRALFLCAEDGETSAFERALLNNARVCLQGTVCRIEEKEKVTALCLKENTVYVDGQVYEGSGILVYISHSDGEYGAGGTDSTRGTDNTGSSDSTPACPARIGNTLWVQGEGAAFDTARNPGCFDQRAYYRIQGIHALVWADELKIISEDVDWMKERLSRLRAGWKRLLNRHLGEYYGGTMSAILLGEKSGLDDEMKKTYQKNGISHILAISGLHMSFIGMGFYGLLRRAGCSFLPAGAAGGALLICYSLMIGAQASASRALIMFLVRMGAEITGRDYDPPTSLFLSAAILCARRPLYLTDAGFLLSYGAILGICLLTPVFEEMFGLRKGEADREREADRKRRGASGGRITVFLRGCAQKLTGALSGSLAVSIFLLGPLLYFYYEVPPYSIFLNLIVIPAMPAVMAAGVAGSLAALVSDTLGGGVLKLCQGVLWLYDVLCGMGSALPGSRFVTGKPDAAWLVIYYAGTAAVCIVFRLLVQKRDKKKLRRASAARIPGAALILFSVGMAAGCRMQYTCGEGMQVTVLDVGQGDSIYIGSPTLDCLVDGGSSDVSSPGEYRIMPYLLSRAVDKLDYVFVTHGDEDHINGIQELLSGQDMGVEVKNLVLPPERFIDEKLAGLASVAVQNGTEVLTMERGSSVTDPGDGGREAVITCLSPDSTDDIGSGNAASLVLEVSYGEFDMILTGDVEGAGEVSLMDSGLLKECDVLKAAHHGSKNSGSEEFLEMVSPGVTVISAGRDNRYGHPHQETLDRLEDAGSKVYSTQERGAVTIWTDGESMWNQPFHSGRFL